MSDFSNAVMQRHLRQADVVMPRPLGLYEPIQKFVTDAPEEIGQSDLDVLSNTKLNADMGPSDIPQQFQRQKPYHSHADNLSSQTNANTPLSSELKGTNPAPFIPQSNSDQLKPPTPLAITLVRTVEIPHTMDNDLKDNNVQPEKTGQPAPRHLNMFQGKNFEGNAVGTLSKPDTANRIIQPASRHIKPGNQVPVIQSGRLLVPPQTNQTPSAPIIKVSIGRIEVKAVVQTPSSQTKSSPPPRPRMSLDEYLKNQDNHVK